MLSGLSKLV